MTPKSLRKWMYDLEFAYRRRVSQREAAELIHTPLRTFEDWIHGRRRIPGSVGLACSAVLYGLGSYE